MRKKAFRRMSRNGYHSYKGAKPRVKRKSKVESSIAQILPKDYRKSIPIAIVVIK